MNDSVLKSLKIFQMVRKNHTLILSAGGQMVNRLELNDNSCLQHLYRILCKFENCMIVRSMSEDRDHDFKLNCINF